MRDRDTTIEKNTTNLLFIFSSFVIVFKIFYANQHLPDAPGAEYTLPQFKNKFILV
jgi:hypothetical protein